MAKRYDDDGHGKYLGLRMQPFSAVILSNEQTSNDKEKRHRTKVLAALRRVNPYGYGTRLCAFKLFILKALCSV